jgi:hypothetical protein
MSALELNTNKPTYVTYSQMHSSDTLVTTYETKTYIVSYNYLKNNKTLIIIIE